MAEHRTVWRFQPLDTWFFRESRPFDAVGGTELESLFPPPVRTLAGAVRSTMGETGQIDWHEYRRKWDGGKGRYESTAGADFYEEMGYADHLGALTLQGPSIEFDGKPLFSWPQVVVTEKDNAIGRMRLYPGRPVRARIGRVAGSTEVLPIAFPALPAGGVDRVTDRWLTLEGYECVLRGELPSGENVIPAEELYSVEHRTGIGRHHASGTVKIGAFYQTAHLRLDERVSVAIGVGSASDRLVPSSSQTVMLGGERRLAVLEITKGRLPIPTEPEADENTEGLILVLASAADLNGSIVPDDFRLQPDADGNGVWRGAIDGVGIDIVNAVSGSVRRRGGWDMVRRAPRDVRSLVPPGSAWFCRASDGGSGRALQPLIERLHGAQIGAEQQLGRGRLLAGLWQRQT